MTATAPILTDTTAFALVKYLREALGDHPGYRRIYAHDAATLVVNPPLGPGEHDGGIIERQHGEQFSVYRTDHPGFRTTANVSTPRGQIALCEAVVVLLFEEDYTNAGGDQLALDEWERANPWYPTSGDDKRED